MSRKLRETTLLPRCHRREKLRSTACERQGDDYIAWNGINAYSDQVCIVLRLEISAAYNPVLTILHLCFSCRPVAG